MVSEVQKIIDAGRHNEVLVQSLFGLRMKHTSRVKTPTTGMACSQRCTTKETPNQVLGTGDATCPSSSTSSPPIRKHANRGGKKISCESEPKPVVFGKSSAASPSSSPTSSASTLDPPVLSDISDEEGVFSGFGHDDNEAAAQLAVVKVAATEMESGSGQDAEQDSRGRTRLVGLQVSDIVWWFGSILDFEMY